MIGSTSDDRTNDAFQLTVPVADDGLELILGAAMSDEGIPL
jgi:hypothetical protein